MLRLSVNLFWLAFASDGLLALCDEILPGSGLLVLRGWLALFILLASILMILLIVATPRIPKRVVVPLLLFIWWISLASAFPMRRFDIPHIDIWLTLLQLGFAFGLLILFGQKRALLPFTVRDGPDFSWRHTLMAGPAIGLVLLLSSVIALVSGVAAEIEQRTGGYVRVYPDGVYLIERHFQLQEKEVRLSGMMHVAREEFYSGVLPKADPAFPSVVLVEGVTDHKRLLGKGSLKYANVARIFNITAQEDSVFSDHVVAGLSREEETPSPSEKTSEPSAPAAEIRFKHADVDVESFHPKTIAFIVAVTALFQARDFGDAFTALADPNSPLADLEVQTLAMEDILHARNRRLLSEIETSMKDYRRIIVPWGALHLPEVESWLRSRNFVQSGETERKAMAFW